MRSFVSRLVSAFPFRSGGVKGRSAWAVWKGYSSAIEGVEQTNARLETRIRHSEAELEARHVRLLEVEHQQLLARERQKLMSDLHDGVGWSLMSALKVVERGQVGQAEIAQLLRDCIDDLKLTVDGLEQVEGDLPLLLAMVRFRLEPRFEGAGVKLIWDIGDCPPLPWLNAESALQILRIMQEAFTNIIKHAEAREVRVTTAVTRDEVIVAVEDDGVGFETGGASGKPAGRGLSNITRRANILHAAIRWDSTPGLTRVALHLPLAVK